MIVPVMAISNLVLTQQIYSEETNGAHAHYRELVPLIFNVVLVPRVQLSFMSACDHGVVLLSTYFDEFTYFNCL